MTECKECGLDLEEWEVGLICEGCAIRIEDKWKNKSRGDGEE